MRFILFLTAAALTALLAASTHAQDCSCCPQCGCHNLTKVCRLVPVVTKVPQTEYWCKCDDICVPGHSKCLGKECVTDCDGHVHHHKVFEPCCGKIYTRVTPGKTTTMTEKCTYKCVVEYVCGKCGGSPGPAYAPVAPGAHPGEPGDGGHPPHWHRSN